MKKRIKKGVLLGKDAYSVIKRYLPVAGYIMSKKLGDIERFAKKHGFPLVLKIISKQAVHKTEINGVKIVNSYIELQKSFNDILMIARKKKIKIEGILCQEFVKGQEVIIGLKKDNTFGHVILFGIGGVLVEVLRDITFRVCPITDEDAKSMLKDLKFRKLFDGVRGRKPVNLKLLMKVLVDVSRMPLKYPYISELDINPFIINDKEGKAVDARIVM